MCNWIDRSADGAAITPFVKRFLRSLSLCPQMNMLRVICSNSEPTEIIFVISRVKRDRTWSLTTWDATHARIQFQFVSSLRRWTTHRQTLDGELMCTERNTNEWCMARKRTAAAADNIHWVWIEFPHIHIHTLRQEPELHRHHAPEIE